MKKQTILFDLDDTLVHCNKYFVLVIDQFIDVMLTWFSGHRLNEADIKKKQLEIDLAGVQIHGFKVERFPQSFVETYHFFAETFNRETSKEEEELLYKLGHTVYAQTIEPYPQMNETLQTLHNEGHTLYLYTGGDASTQMRKIKEAGLETYFDDRIFVTLHKTVDFMESLLTTQRFDRNHTWMIGNSVRTDVIPSLQAGINSIYIPAKKEWEFNTGEITITPRNAFYQLASLQEVPDTIEEHIINALSN